MGERKEVTKQERRREGRKQPGEGRREVGGKEKGRKDGRKKEGEIGKERQQEGIRKYRIRNGQITI